MKSYIYTVIIILNIFLFNSAFAEEQSGSEKTRVISGKVVDSNNKTLEGVNIVIRNSNIGVSTDSKGEFFIKNAPVGKITLQFSMIGFKSQTQILKTGQNIQDLLITLEQGTIEMGAVVVTGTSTPHLYEDVPVKTEIITKSMMKQSNSLNLAEALSLQTGIQVENNCNNCNFTQVRILGFEGKYSQILIDGNAVIGTLGGVYGLEHFPEEMIDQIEIVKGGSSALYGAGAISGVVNLITRRPMINKTNINYSGNLIDSKFDQKIGTVAEIVSDNKNLGAFVYGSARNRLAYDRNDDGFSELGNLKNEIIGFNIFYKPFENSDLFISFNRIHEDRRGGSELEKPIHEARIAEWTEHFRWGGNIEWQHRISSAFQYNMNYALSLLERDSYYGGRSGDSEEERLEALNFYGFAENSIHNFNSRLLFNSGNHNLIAGIQLFYDELIDKSVTNSAYYINQNFNNIGFYLQDEFSFDDKNDFLLVAGFRLDKHSALEKYVLSPRFNLKYRMNENIVFRGGVTTGFKAPQIFDEDLHICGLEGDQKVIRNSANLKEEKSYSLNAGFEFQKNTSNSAYLLGATFFYTLLNDAYSEVFLLSDGPIDLWERINSSGASAAGVEVDLGYKPTSTIEFRIGITYKQNKYDEVNSDFNTKEFLRTPDLFGYIRSTIDISQFVKIYASLKYTGSMFNPHEISVEGQEDPSLVLTKSDPFTEIDFGLTYKFDFIDASLSLGVKNLTDAFQKDLDYGVNRDPGYVYGPMLPRTIYFNINTSL